MNKLFKMLQESFGSAPQRNGFDLSRRDVFSTKVGMKLPFFCLETVPNDYHEIRPIDLIRSLPMEQANFVRMKQHIDFYWVPMTAFQTNFHEVIQQTTDPVNAMMVGSLAKSFPMFPLDGLLMAIAYSHYVYLKGGSATLSLEQFLRDVFAQVGDDLFESYRNVEQYVYMFTIGVGAERVLAEDMFGNPLYQGAVRLLDMLGYGNYLQLLPPTLDDYAQDKYESAMLLLLTSVIGKKINLNRFAAYQCVYQNFGLNTVYDKLDIYSFNFDDVVADGGNWTTRFGNSDDIYGKINCIFTLRYSQWKKDIFTAAYPDSQFGGVSVVGVNYAVGVAGSSSGPKYTLGVSESGQLASINASQTSYSRSVISSFSVLDLRRAEALQGWKEDMMRSGFRAKQRQKSQFGVSPSYDPHNMPYILGSVSSDIQKDVTTGTSGADFGELVSNGVSTLGNEVIKFDGSGRNDFGVIVGVLSIVPEADYDSFGMDLHNVKSEPFDYYTPAFQNIGLQALPGQYLNMLLAGTGGTSLPAIFGYVPRYAEYKQAYDKVHGEFCKFVWSEDSEQFQYDGSLRQYVSTRVDMERNGLTRLSSLYVNPRIVDDIFVSDANGEQNTDQFMVNMYCEVKSVRPMSVLGLPRW